MIIDTNLSDSSRSYEKKPTKRVGQNIRLVPFSRHELFRLSGRSAAQTALNIVCGSFAPPTGKESTPFG